MNGSRESGRLLFLSWDGESHHIGGRIRQVNVSDEQRIWRDFRFGDLIDLVALDTRK